jgi:hypothetical protein
MRTVAAVLLGLACSMSLAGCGTNGSAVPNSVGMRDDPLFQRFVELQPSGEVIFAKRGDVDGDGRDDLIAIYRTAQDLVRMRVLLDRVSGRVLTDEVKAPLEGQTVEIKDIDQNPPSEFVVSGSKGGFVGYAIFRVVGTALDDVFGSGMEGCCGN